MSTEEAIQVFKQDLASAMQGINSKLDSHRSHIAYAVEGITVLCHFREDDLIPVIICKNDKHQVTLYNIIFANMTSILS